MSPVPILPSSVSSRRWMKGDRVLIGIHPGRIVRGRAGSYVVEMDEGGRRYVLSAEMSEAGCTGTTGEIPDEIQPESGSGA